VRNGKKKEKTRKLHGMKKGAKKLVKRQGKGKGNEENEEMNEEALSLSCFHFSQYFPFLSPPFLVDMQRI